MFHLYIIQLLIDIIFKSLILNKKKPAIACRLFSIRCKLISKVGVLSCFSRLKNFFQCINQAN